MERTNVATWYENVMIIIGNLQKLYFLWPN